MPECAPSGRGKFMGILDAFHSVSDLRTKKHDRRLRSEESAAKVNHASSEAKRIDAEAAAKLAAIEMERDRFNHEVQKWHIDTRYKTAILEEQIRAYREARADGADTNFHGLQVRYRRAPTAIEGAQQEELAAALPGRIDFIEILEAWRPSLQQIFLGLAPGGEHITVPLPALCHVALCGSTGSGKSNLMRLLLSQLLFVGAHVVIADPHYTAVDVESDEDWRPIEKRLAVEPAVSAKEIKDLLKWMAVDALPKRLAQRRRGEHVGRPCFLAMDELPAIVHKVPEASDYMGEIGREGRKVGLYLISSAQDFLVKTIGGNGAARDNFRTAIYGGGDATSARVLLDVRGTVDDGTLGKGVVMCRSQAQPQAAMMRVPYCSNQALYRLLPTATTARDTTAFTTAEDETEPLRNPTAVVESTLARRENGRMDARSMRIRELVKARVKPSKIIEEVWGISAKQGGDAYRKASDELASIMSDLV